MNLFRKALPPNYRIGSYCYDTGTGHGDDRYDYGLFVYEERLIRRRRWFRKPSLTWTWSWYFVQHSRDKDELRQTAWLRHGRGMEDA